MDVVDADEQAESKYVKNTLPWVEKYRPKSLGELIAHEEIIQILNKLIDSNKLPHLLFYGPPGTGKTSTAMACAKKMYGEHYSSMTLELNASDDRGIDVVRNQIKEFAGTKKLFSSGVKLIILDEADAMTSDAQAALRRVIEKYTSNTRFCMICNYVNKIIPALQSRCTKFRFAPLRAEQITSRLQIVIDAENVDCTEDGKNAVLSLAQGDLRRVLNLLQSASMAYDQVTEQAVYLTAGAAMPAVIEVIYTSLMNESFEMAYRSLLKNIVDFGYALCDIVTELSQLVAATELPDAVMAHLMDKMSNVEFRLANGVSEKLQIGAVVGAFTIARAMLTGPKSGEKM
ncbi:hypothetical protein B484DRAFT_412811 [Ochromonadaceae sp. CCMP2298]|nr:hypothetical protein B484DRAFT_412811 [Ochromonadaceae sp. CCMP2298]